MLNKHGTCAHGELVADMCVSFDEPSEGNALDRFYNSKFCGRYVIVYVPAAYSACDRTGICKRIRKNYKLQTNSMNCKQEAHVYAGCILIITMEP